MKAEEAWQIYKNAKLLYTAREVEEALTRMARQISLDFQDDNPILICVMNGGTVPFARLLMQISIPCETDYVHATRYKHGNVGGTLIWVAEPTINPKGREVILIDDILDEGITLKEIGDRYVSLGAKKICYAVMVTKDRKRQYDLTIDYEGLVVPDRYVFGYGMDYKGYLRNVPGIYAES